MQKKSARADEYVRLIKDELTEAVEQCIQAAGAEFEPSVQRGLLRVSLRTCLLFGHPK